MGREATVRATIGAETGEVRALLEARELILRGPIRRRYALAALEAVIVEGAMLRFAAEGEAVALELGQKAAAAWAKAIATPPPSLAAKLGLAGGAKALLIGACDDPALAEALRGALTDDPAGAAMAIAVIDGPAALASAQRAGGALPLWAVYAKGKAAAFGDAAIRAALRDSGYRDTKSCAVSDRLTATRYNRA